MAFACAGVGRAQSGRRQPPPRNPTAPATAPAASEPGADAKAKTEAPPLFTFYVVEDETTNVFMDVPLTTTNLVVASFVRRLQDVAAIKVSTGGKSDRKRAREHAKVEHDAFTILVQVDAQTSGVQPGQRSNRLENLIVRYYVYEPQTATLKYQGQVYMRPYQPSARVGGVRIPVPTSGGRIPLEYVFEQAGREAAERVMSDFQLQIPPDRR